MSLKFAGRTPSSSLRRPHRVLSREQASQRSRAWALRGATLCLAAFFLTTLFHVFVDGSTVSSTRKANLPLSWPEILNAPLLFIGETLRQSGLHGALILLSTFVTASLLWLILSLLGEWRKPPISFLALLALQFFGWAFHVANVRAPATTSAIEYSKGIEEALRLSWNILSRAQQISVVWSALFVICVLWWWGAGIEARPQRWSGSQKAQGFLRRRRTSYQFSGALLMLFSFAGTLLIGTILFGKTLHLTALPISFFWLTPPIAFSLCILLDAIFLQGRRLWRRLS